MTKEEVELIIFKVTADGQDALNMKIYKNGTTCRYGVGGLPQLGISGMSFFNNSIFFDQLITKVPENLLERPLNYEEETPNGYLEYIIAFYGVSRNGDNGERADWTKSTGIRAKLDHQTNFRDPLIGFLDSFTIDAAELTNEWYFDVIILSKYGMKSSTMPNETILAQPKTEEEIHEAYENYINQMTYSARKWSLSTFADNKTYEKNGETFKAFIQQNDNNFSLNFLPSNLGISNLQINSPSNKSESEAKNIEKKKWWQFW